jgi:hypothetical protein
MQTKWDFAGSTDVWSTSAGGHLMKVVNLTGFIVLCCLLCLVFLMLLSLTFRANYSAYLCLVQRILPVLMFGSINVADSCSVLFVMPIRIFGAI